jgi:hypothetical protein
VAPVNESGAILFISSYATVLSSLLIAFERGHDILHAVAVTAVQLFGLLPDTGHLVLELNELNLYLSALSV